MKISPDFVYQNIDWMRLKLKINLSERKVFPRKKEIWWVSLGQNIGVEINGKHSRFERPVLVVKVFNTNSILAIPISTKIKEGEYLFKFMSGSNEIRNANLSQIRSISVKRFLRKIESMSDLDFDKVIEKIKNFLEKAETPSSGVSSELPNWVT
jgi:mRNA interferase MazF